MVVAIPSHPIAGWPHAHATPATHKLPDSGRVARLQAPVVRRAVCPTSSRYLRSPKGEIAVTTPMVAGVIREYGDRVSALGQRYSWSCAQWLAIALSDGRRAGAASGCGAPALGGSPDPCVALCCVGGDCYASRFQLVHRLGIAAGSSLQPTLALAARRLLKAFAGGETVLTELSPPTGLAVCSLPGDDGDGGYSMSISRARSYSASAIQNPASRSASSSVSRSRSSWADARRRIPTTPVTGTS